MKDFVKMTLATLAGLLLFGAVSVFILIAMIGALAAMGDTQPVIPSEGMLKMDMSSISISEQATEADPFAILQSGGQQVTSVGIYSAIKAVNAAAQDPAVKFIYLRPDGVTGGFAQMEELRKALKNFRASGKAIVSYMENPTNAGYYLASVSDKIYMTSHEGGLNMFCGISSQMIFLKDILDRLGINMQLIRHGKYKSAGEMFVRNSSSKENMEQNKAMIESVWDSWACEIAESRGMSTAELNRIIDNLELVSPSDWLETGLVDELLDREALSQKLCTLYSAESIDDINTIAFADYVLAMNNTINLKAKKKIAVIYASGNIIDGKEKQQVAGDRYAEILAQVRQDSTIKAVVLRVNSPGGSVLASDKIRTELELIQESRPVIASFGDYAASGGYWISAGCDRIYTNRTSLTGSIGVFSMIPDFSGTIEDKLHINITPVNSNRHSDLYNGLRPLDTKEIAYMQTNVENIYREFTEIVSEGRDLTVAEVDAIAQGRVWTGSDALLIGLADEIGTIENAIDYAVIAAGAEGMDEVQIVEYPKPQTTLDILLESFGGSSVNIFNDTPLEDVAEAFSTVNGNEIGKVYARIPYEIILR
ncbi:MAG: signal peptide peptidase SppA [Bacteroidales bacterium]|nr:signal peptide peptidase SppA [Bacteroidales bacterium]